MLNLWRHVPKVASLHAGFGAVVAQCSRFGRRGQMNAHAVRVESTQRTHLTTQRLWRRVREVMFFACTCRLGAILSLLRRVPKVTVLHASFRVVSHDLVVRSCSCVVT